MPLILRDDQSAVADNVRAAFASGVSAVALCAPTGWGKTVAFSYIVKSAAKKGKRVLILAHRIEIIEQIFGAGSLRRRAWADQSWRSADRS